MVASETTKKKGLITAAAAAASVLLRPICFVDAAVEEAAAAGDRSDEHDKDTATEEDAADTAQQKDAAATTEQQLRFLSSPSCHHACCVLCWDHVLLAHPSVTTMYGSCPLCQGPVSHFDLVLHDNSSKSGSTEMASATSTATLPEELHSAIFAICEGIGWGSFHFPAAAATAASNQSPSSLPYLARSRGEEDGAIVHEKIVFLSTAYHAPTHTWQGIAATTPDMLRRILLTFSDDYGHVTWGAIVNENNSNAVGNSMDGVWTVQYKNEQGERMVQDVDIIEGNFQDYRTTNGGGRSNSNNNNNNTSRPHERWCQIVIVILSPLAGAADDEGDDGREEEESAKFCVTINGHAFDQGTAVASLQMPRKHCRLTATTATTTTTTNKEEEEEDVDDTIFDWNAHPEGPVEIGSKVVFQWKNSTKDLHTWIQKTPLPPPASQILLGRASGQELCRVEKTYTLGCWQASPVYHPNALHGNVFCQTYKVGVASYHFVLIQAADNDATTATSTDEPHRAYISYEHRAMARWPPLDDGRPLPARVPFRDARWNADMRIF
jgi:hypothetical protein